MDRYCEHTVTFSRFWMRQRGRYGVDKQELQEKVRFCDPKKKEDALESNIRGPEPYAGHLCTCCVADRCRGMSGRSYWTLDKTRCIAVLLGACCVLEHGWVIVRPVFQGRGARHDEKPMGGGRKKFFCKWPKRRWLPRNDMLSRISFTTSNSSYFHSCIFTRMARKVLYGGIQKCKWNFDVEGARASIFNRLTQPTVIPCNPFDNTS